MKRHRDLWGPITGWMFTRPQGWVTAAALGLVMWTPPGFAVGLTVAVGISAAERCPRRRR